MVTLSLPLPTGEVPLEDEVAARLLTRVLTAPVLPPGCYPARLATIELLPYRDGRYVRWVFHVNTANGVVALSLPTPDSGAQAHHCLEALLGRRPLPEETINGEKDLCGRSCRVQVVHRDVPALGLQSRIEKVVPLAGACGAPDGPPHVMRSESPADPALQEE
jgi:hypothetical protein